MKEQPPELSELEHRRIRALTERDFRALANLCHRSLRYTHSTGFTDTCESYLERCRSRYYLYDSVDCRVDSSVLVGDTVVLDETMSAQIKVGGQVRALCTRALAVWVRVDGAWQFLAYQATPLSSG